MGRYSPLLLSRSAAAHLAEILRLRKSLEEERRNSSARVTQVEQMAAHLKSKYESEVG